MRKPNLFPIFLTVLVDLLGMMMIVPILPFYAQKYGASPVQIGFLSASFALCQFFASPILGRLSDKFGRKPILVVSQIGTFFGFFLMAGATHLWVLFVARMIDGFTAGNISLAQAYVADVTDPENRARSFGLLGVSFGLGLLLGPAASGLLAQYDMSYPIYAAMGLSAISVFVSAWLLPAVSPPRATGQTVFRSELFRSDTLAPLLVLFFVFVFAFAFFAEGLGLFAQNRFTRNDGRAFGPTEIGYLLSYCGLLGIFFQGWLLGRLVKRFGEEKLVRIGFFADMVGYALLGFATDLVLLVVSCTLFSFGNSTLRPSLTSLITQRAKPEQRGAVLGITTSLQSLGQMIAPPLGGLLIQHRLLVPWGLTLSSFAALALLLIALSARKGTVAPELQQQI